MADNPYCTGEYSYLANARRMAFNTYDEISIANNPDGSPGDLDAAIRANSIIGEWIPLKVPEGCDGASDHIADGIFYTVNTSDLDERLAAAPDDDARWELALSIGRDEVATSTAGHPYVRE
jgi:hypothetical protein